MAKGAICGAPKMIKKCMAIPPQTMMYKAEHKMERMGGFKAMNLAAPKKMLGFTGAPQMIQKNNLAMDKSKNKDSAELMNKVNFNNNRNNEIKDELTRLIIIQDIIEGSWNENEETKKLINIITKDKFNLINNKVKGLNKGEQETKIIYTIVVIYFLMTKHSDKLNEYRLIINKAKKFLMSQGIKYEDFIRGI